MNSEKLTVSLYVRWFTSVLFCTFVSVFFLFAFYSRVGFLIAQLCCGGMYFALIIQACYTIGSRDHNRYLFDKCPKTPLKGLWAGLITAIPSFISAIVLIVCKLAESNNSLVLLIYRIINSQFYALNLMILPTALSLNEISLVAVLGSAALTLLMPVIAWLSYLAGFSNADFLYGLIKITGKKKGA